MNRIPPCMRLSKELRDLTNEKISTEGSLLATIMRKGAKLSA
jgi:hypothetical protein